MILLVYTLCQSWMTDTGGTDENPDQTKSNPIDFGTIHNYYFFLINWWYIKWLYYFLYMEIKNKLVFCKPSINDWNRPFQSGHGHTVNTQGHTQMIISVDYNLHISILYYANWISQYIPRTIFLSKINKVSSENETGRRPEKVRGKNKILYF